MASKKHPAQADFRIFMFMVWKFLNLPDPTPAQYDIAYQLQHGPRRFVIEAFRGIGKSWITSAFVCWLLWNNPQLKILVVSASKSKADENATFIKQLINNMPILAHLRPSGTQRDSVLSFDVGPALPDQSPSVKSAGITGQITGSRADIIIGDDIEVPNNSATQMMRDKLAESVKEFDAILKPLDTARIIYLGTPQTEMSLYNQLPERGYTIKVWPALYPQLKKINSYKGTLAAYITKALELDPSLSGSPTDAQRFNDQDLMERKASYGPSGFALQFMLDTSLSDGDRYPLKIADLIVQSLNPTMAHVKLAWAAAPEVVVNDLPAVALQGDRYHRPMWTSSEMSDYTGCVMAIDPSGRGQDETGYAIIKILTGNLFLVASGGLKGGYEDETLMTLSNLAKTHKANHVIIEANFGDGMYTKLITPFFAKAGHKVLVEEVKHSVQKEQRIIDTLEPVLANHKLIVDPRVIEADFKTSEADVKYGLFYQLTRITREKGALAHDDRLDALAIAVAYWIEHMSRDNDKAAASIKTRAMANELKRWKKGIVSAGVKAISKPSGGSWLHSNKSSR